MLLFKDYHIAMILDGSKTETRRLWKRSRCRVGAIHQCKTTLFGEVRARVEILSVHSERLHDITEDGARAEGTYTRDMFLRKWFDINPKSPPNPDLWVVKFKVIK